MSSSQELVDYQLQAPSLHHSRGKKARFLSTRVDQVDSKRDRIPPPFDTPHIKANPRPPNQEYACIFCKIKGSVPECEGELLGPFQLNSKRQIMYYVHSNCAIWHPKVFERDNQIFNLNEAIKLSRSKQCYACLEKGATLGCAHGGKKCCRSTHFRCGLLYGALLFRFEVRCPRHGSFSFDRSSVMSFLECTPVNSAALRYGNGCTVCDKASYDFKKPEVRLLTCSNCFGRTHTRCTVDKSDMLDLNMTINSFKGNHHCEKCMVCAKCQRRVDQRAYAIRRRCAKLIQNSELDWDLTQENDEDCNVLVCVGCNHFAVHLDCLNSPRSGQTIWRCALCYICRHCNSTAPQNGWNEQYEACASCYLKIKNDGVICPVCKILYRENDGLEMIQCDGCDRWIHAVTCGGLSVAQFKAVGEDSSKYFCPICVRKRSSVPKGRIKYGIIGERLLSFGGPFPKALNTILRKIPPPYKEHAFYSVQLPNKDESEVSSKALQELAIDVDICRRCCSGVTKGRSKCCITCGDFFHEQCIRHKHGTSFKLTNAKHTFWQCNECHVNWNAKSFVNPVSNKNICDASTTNGKVIETKSTKTLVDGLVKEGRRRRRLVNWIDERNCELCNQGEHKGNVEGPLITWSSSMNCDLGDVWVHVSCILMSSGMILHHTDETCFTIIGSRRTLLTAAKRSRCSKCGKNGATVKCSVNGCRKLYHFRCAGAAGVTCVIKLKSSKNKRMLKRKKNLALTDIETVHVVCKKHITNPGKKRTQVMGILDIPEIIDSVGMIRVIDSQGYIVNPNVLKERVVSMKRKVRMRVGSLAVPHFGEVIPEVNDFIVDGCLVPLGYCSIRRFWSMSRFGKRCTYFFEVKGHAQSGPTFVIRSSEDLNLRLEGRNLDLLWSFVWRKAMEVQLKFKPNKNDLSRSGLEMFGLSNCESIVRHIECLPLVGMFNVRYKPRCNVEITSDVVFYDSLAKKYTPQLVLVNSSNSARVEGYRRRGERQEGDGAHYENMRSGSVFQMRIAREMLCDIGDKQRINSEKYRSIVIEKASDRRGHSSTSRGRKGFSVNNSNGGEPSCRRSTEDAGAGFGRGRKRRRSTRDTKSLSNVEEVKLKSEAEEVIVQVDRKEGSKRNQCLVPSAKSKTIILRSEIDGWGVFATEDILAGALIIEYVGEIIRPSLSDIREQQYLEKGVGCYMFEIRPGEIVDATMCGNAARYINHSCVPNCFSKTVWAGGGKPLHQVVGIFSKRDIQRGEELSYDYQFPYDENDRVKCGCGAEQCKGFMN